jgi:DNA-binding NarL/FixJ family response regulator
MAVETLLGLKNTALVYKPKVMFCYDLKPVPSHRLSPSTEMPIRILLADDQLLFCQAMSTLLEEQPDMQVAGIALDGGQAVTQHSVLQPDVVLMDLHMPFLSGVEATRQIRSSFPSARVLVLTTFDEEAEIFDALQAGAAGYILKNSPVEELVRAIRVVLRGEIYLQPAVAQRVVAGYQKLAKEAEQSRPYLKAQELGLSSREMEVLSLVSRGRSNKEMASDLHLTLGTVKNHVTQVLLKLGVADRTTAALRARDLGLT